MRLDKINRAKQRLAEGFYDSPMVLAQLVDELGRRGIVGERFVNRVVDMAQRRAHARATLKLWTESEARQ